MKKAINYKTKDSPLITATIIILIISIVYFILFKTFASFAPCSQKGSGKLDFDLLFSCIDVFKNVTLGFLGLSLLALFLIKKDNKILNFKGVIVARIVIFLGFIIFLIMDVFNLL